MRKQGFAMVTTIIILSIILGIFHNYARATRSKKKMLQSSLSSTTAEKSVQESNSIGIYEMYIADQIITANNLKILVDGGETLGDIRLVPEATGIQNIIGYFTVKDSTSNIGITSQEAAIKVWENDSSLPVGQWYYGQWEGTSPDYVFKRYNLTPTIADPYNIPVTKGGYIITSIVDKTPEVLPYSPFEVQLDERNTPILDTSGGRVRYYNSATPKGVMKYHSGANHTIYEVKLFKNVTLFKKVIHDSKGTDFMVTYNYDEVIRSYNIYVTLNIYWTKNIVEQQADLIMRNNCSAAPNPGVSTKVGRNCGIDGNGDMVVSEVSSFIIEDIFPTIE